MHLSVGPHLRCAGGNAVASAILMQICTARSALPTDIMQFSLMNLPQDGVLFVICSHIDCCIVVAQNLAVKNDMFTLL